MKNIINFLLSVTTAGFLLLLFAIALAFATFVENSYGVEAARSLVYNSWWLELILLLLSANMISNFIRYKMYKPQKLTMGTFHLAFILIIIGAGVTRYFGSEGVMHIREGESTNVLVSAETKFNVVAEYKGEQHRISMSASQSSLSGKKISSAIHIGGKEIVVKLVEYLPEAQRTIEPDSHGEPIIDFVYAQNGSMKGELLHSGQVVNANDNVTVGFNASANVRFMLRGDSLMLSARDTISSMDMQGKDAINFPPGTEIECAEKVIYRIGSTSLVVKRFLPSAKAVAVAGNGTPTGENALTIQLTDNQKQQLVTLWTSGKNESSKYTATLEGVNYRLWIGPEETILPFSIKLNDFVLSRYPGSNSPSSYESLITLTDSELSVKKDYKIFMNNVLKHRGYRFYQSSYDMDEKGTILSVNHDLAGTGITYLGYFLLFLGILLSIFNPRSHFFGLMKRASAGTSLLLFLLLSSFSSGAAEPQPVSPVIAKEFAKVWVQGHDGRIKPFSTLAYEVVMKVSRSEALAGQSPEQVVLGMSARPQEWQQVEMIAISDDKIEAKLGRSGGKATFGDFFDQQGNYKLANDVQLSYGKNPAERNVYDNNIIKVDDRLNVVYQVYHGDMFRFFPSPNSSDQTWYTPIAKLPASFGPDSVIVLRSFPNVLMALQSGDTESGVRSSAFIVGYQERYGSALIPGKTKQQLEILYNHINIFKELSIWYVLLGFILVGLFFYSLFTGKPLRKKAVTYAVIGLFVGFLAHVAGLIVRGYVSGHMPWSNGYESMIYIAWAIMLAGLIFARRNPMVLAAAAILSGLTLFVAQMSWLNPEITNLVPVLKSYWLAIHVAVITASYGFLGVSAIIGYIVLIMAAFQNPANRGRIILTVEHLTLINEAAMILGLYFLTIGTFLGGIWANESWGRYWGWDAKETWSLITILIYGFISHMRLIPGFRGWFAYNLASVIGLMSVLMTYLGVNYYLSGLHSYGSGEGLQFPIVLVVVFALIAVIAIVAKKKEDTLGGRNL